MADIEKCKEWIDKARNLLGITGTGPKMAKRNAEIASLLKSMDEIIKSDPTDYPVLKSKQKFDKFKAEFDILAKQFEDFSKIAEAAVPKEDKDAAKKLGKDLRLLKQSARLALGKAKPTENGKVKNQMLQAARNEPVYRDRRKQIEQALAKLKTLPGTGEHQKEMQQALDNTAKMEPDYTTAAKALGRFLAFNVYKDGILKEWVQQAEMDSADLPEKLFDKELAGEYRRAESIVEAYAKKAQLSAADKVRDFRQTLQTLLGEVEKDRDGDKAYKAIGQLVDAVNLATKECDKALDSMQGPKNLVDIKWKELEKQKSLGDVAVLKADRTRAESLESCQLYDDAAKAYTKLYKDIDKAMDKARSAPKDWKDLQAEISGMEKTLESGQVYPELGATVGQIRTAIEQARKAAELNNDYPAACKLIKGKRKDVDDLTKAVDVLSKKDGKSIPAVEFKSKTRTLEVKLTGLTQAVEQLVRDVQAKEIAALEKAGGNAAPLIDKCDAYLKKHKAYVVKVWTRFTAGGSDAKILKTLLQDIDAQFQDAVKQIKRIGDSAAKTTVDDALLKTSKQDAITDKNQKASLAAIGKAQGVIDELEDLHLPADHASTKVLTKARQDLKELTVSVPNGKVLAPLAEIVQDALEKEKKKIEGEIEKNRETAAKKAEELNKKIDKLEKEDPKYKEFFVTVRVDIAAAAGKLSSKVFAVSKKGADSLEQIENKIDGLKTDLKDDTKNYTAVDNLIKDIRKRVEVLKTQDPKSHARVEHAFEKVLVPKVRKLLPKDALTKLQEFRDKELTKAENAASDLEKEMATFRTAATALKNDLKQSGLEKSASALYKSLMARRDGAKAQAASNLDMANNELAAIRLLMDVAKEDPDKLNAGAEEDRYENERRTEEYKAARELFRNNYSQQAANASEDRQDEFKAMQSMVKQADKSASRKDFAGARDSLNRAVEMAKFIVENSNDDVSPIGRDLIKLNQTWKVRVSEYLKQITNLAHAIDTAVPAQGDNRVIKKKKTHGALDPLLSLFDPRAFDAPIDALTKTKPKPDVNVRRKTKEEALVRIRRFQATLKSNVVLKHAATAEMPLPKVVLKPLRDTLAGLQAEVLGS